MKNKIIIVGGDPNSINSEIIYKSLKKINKSIKKRIYLIINYDLFLKQLKKLKYSLKIAKVDNINDYLNDSRLKILDININSKKIFNIDSKVASKYVLNSLNYAHSLGNRNDVKGIINCPLDKNLLNQSQIGVTEYLARKNKIKKDSEVMLIFNKKLSVSPITTHVSLKKVSKKINQRMIREKIKTIELWFKKQYRRKPKLAILGLNPHNAEFNKNSEEVKIILPAIESLKKNGNIISGPMPADTIFINDYKKYDVIIGMFHDQVLAPFKTLFKFDAVNLTLGLNYLRMSPDHGTAKNLIGKNKADSSSLVKCINYMNSFKK